MGVSRPHPAAVPGSLPARTAPAPEPLRARRVLWSGAGSWTLLHSRPSAGVDSSWEELPVPSLGPLTVPQDRWGSSFARLPLAPRGAYCMWGSARGAGPDKRWSAARDRAGLITKPPARRPCHAVTRPKEVHARRDVGA
jgi:hypothetical protein